MRAPVGGYRITAGRVIIIPDRAEALQGAKVYVGDGATITRSMVRTVDENLIGHTPIRTQLTWCQKESVPRAIFILCGSRIVKRHERTLGDQIRQRR